jgi:excisionase family DNA binding protein
MTEAEYGPLLTPAELATRLKVDVKTTSRWAKEGKIHAIRTLGGHRRFFEREIDALARGETWEPPGGWPPEPDHLAAPLRTLWPPTVTGTAAAVRNKLQTSGVATVGELAGHTADDLRELGLRPPQVDEVRLVLHKKGLALHGEIADRTAA